MDQHGATIQFTDGAWRSVYEGPDGRQYVFDDDGLEVHGVWILDAEAHGRRRVF